MKVSIHGAVSGVAILPLPGGSFAAGTDLGRTNIVGTGMVMSCDYDYLSRIQGCLEETLKRSLCKTEIHQPQVPMVHLLMRHQRGPSRCDRWLQRSNGKNLGYGKNYDSIAPIALSLDGNQAFILGSLGQPRAGGSSWAGSGQIPGRATPESNSRIERVAQRCCLQSCSAPPCTLRRSKDA